MSNDTSTQFVSTDLAVPGDPFVRLRYHYGMLLGAEDFAVEQREKVLRRRLHQALLHGVGTVWGLRVQMSPPDENGRCRELRVESGLAVDGIGRDVVVPDLQCLDLSGLAQHEVWKRLKPPGETTPGSSSSAGAGSSSSAGASSSSSAGAGSSSSAGASTSSRRRAYVVLRFDSCQSQPVPAIVPPCNEPGDAVAFSRMTDGARIDLEADPPPEPHPLQRDWFSRLSDPNLAGRSIRDILLEHLMTPAGTPASPAALARFYRNIDDAPLLLASVDLDVEGTGDAALAYAVAVDNSVRALLPPLQLVAESLFGQRLARSDDSAGLRLTGWKGEAALNRLRVQLTTPVHPQTAKPGAVQILKFDAGGWSDLTSSLQITPDGSDLLLVITAAAQAFGTWADGTKFQIYVNGDRPGPLLGADGSPFAGIVGDPLPAAGHGRSASIIGTWKTP